MKLLNNEEIRSSKGATQWLYVLHGIYGAGRNWSSVVRRFAGAHTEWNARLLDLRQHGLSQGFPPPHTIQAAASPLRSRMISDSAIRHSLPKLRCTGRVLNPLGST